MPTEQEKQFIDAWKFAGPELERIRNDELKQLDESAGLKLLGATVAAKPIHTGLAIFQAWMMRLRIIELSAEVASLKSEIESINRQGAAEPPNR